MKQSAVEWLYEQVWITTMSELPKKLQQAKEMEKQQNDKFAIKFAEWLNTYEAKYLIEDLILEGELNKNPKTKELLKIFKNK
jgi:hypothetical protein